MKFKNKLEEDCFLIGKRIFQNSIYLDHNKKIQIENTLLPHVASFAGPPTKEIDVIAVNIIEKPTKVTLLISCKELKKKAEPAHIQEWCSVVQTMNKCSTETKYLGLVVAPNGYTSGCEAWATSNNIGIIPPIKGVSISYSNETINKMLERVLNGINKRIKIKYDDLIEPSAFFDFVFSLVCDFEGREEHAKENRYIIEPEQWLSSFGEIYSKIDKKIIRDIKAFDDSTVIFFSDNHFLKFTEEQVIYGESFASDFSAETNPICRKNISFENCSLEFIKSNVIGKKVTSAGDFKNYFELGIDSIFNFGLHLDFFHIISTVNPSDENQL